MSAQVFSLEQVCQERAGWYSPHEARTRQKGSVRETLPKVTTYHKLHEALRRLMSVLTSSLPLSEFLQALTSLMVEALDVDLCVVLLREQEMLHLVSCTPNLRERIIVQSVQVSDVLWEQMCIALQHGHMPDLSAVELEQLNPLLNVQYQTLLPVPLIAGNICSGLLLCYSSRRWDYSDDDELMLCTVATQAALAVQRLQALEEDLQEQKGLIRTFVHDLCEGNADSEELLHRRAYSLGYDLTKPHVVALVEFSDSEKSGKHKEARPIEESLALYEGLSSQVGHQIQEQYPGSLVATRNDLLICLLAVDSEQGIEQLHTWCNHLVGQMKSEQAARMYVGISNSCQRVSEYRRGYAEAQESLEVGRSIHAQGGCSHFNALGAYRYLYTFAHADTLCDQYQEQIAIIVDYDRRKKTNLLDTLESYLECGGNIAKTSTQLEVHRNTLLQRLERIQKLCTLDMEQLHVRFPLLLALKVHRLRMHHSA